MIDFSIENRIEDIKDFLRNPLVPSIFFEGTKELKLYNILKSGYPRFFSAYSLQVKSGHDRKTIISTLDKWERLSLVDVITNANNCREWRFRLEKI